MNFAIHGGLIPSEYVRPGRTAEVWEDPIAVAPQKKYVVDWDKNKKRVRTPSLFELGSVRLSLGGIFRPDTPVQYFEDGNLSLALEHYQIAISKTQSHSEQVFIKKRISLCLI